MVVLYKRDGTKSMKLEDNEEVCIKALWVMYKEDFSIIPEEYILRLNGVKVRICETTLNRPKEAESIRLDIDI